MTKSCKLCHQSKELWCKGKFKSIYLIKLFQREFHQCAHNIISEFWPVTRKKLCFPIFFNYFDCCCDSFYLTLIYLALNSILFKISLKIQVNHKVFGSNSSCAQLGFGPKEASRDLPIILKIARPPPSQCPKVGVRTAK